MEILNSNNDTFFCNIADLITQIPTARGIASRCKDYMCEKTDGSEIVIDAQKFKRENYAGLSEEDIVYLECGWQFYRQLLDFGGLYLHSSAVEIDGRAYLFSGPCGTGKSTHTRLWQSHFEGARVFNDDKPALRKIDNKWYAYGTPFCGKDHININMKAQLAGICFLKQADHNSIRRLLPPQAVQKIFTQTFYKFKNPERLEKMARLVEDIVKTIPVFELENRPEIEAAELSFSTMLNAAKEVGL